MRLKFVFQSVSFVSATGKIFEPLTVQVFGATFSVKSLQADEIETGNSTTVVASPSLANGTLLWKYAKAAAVLGGIGFAGSMLMGGRDSVLAKDVPDDLTKSYQNTDIFKTAKDIGEFAVVTGDVLNSIYKNGPISWFIKSQLSKVSSRFYYLLMLLEEYSGVDVAGIDKIKSPSMPPEVDYHIVSNIASKLENSLRDAFEEAVIYERDKDASFRESVSQIHRLIVDAFIKGVISPADGENTQ